MIGNPPIEVRILREIEETNRLLTALLKLQVPVYPTVEELGLVPKK